MGFDPLTSLFDLGKTLIEKLIPDPTAKAQAAQRLLDMQQSGELARLAADTDLAKGQLEINKIEAASPLTFISGARPAIMWVCGAGLAVEYFVGPLIAWGSALFQHPITAPHADMNSLLPLLMSLLGLGAMRSFDKYNGTASK